MNYLSNLIKKYIYIHVFAKEPRVSGMEIIERIIIMPLIVSVYESHTMILLLHMFAHT